MIKCVGNMWWNPKLPLDMRSAASRPTGGESALASLARDMAASQAGSRCASLLSSQLAAETQCSCACLPAHPMQLCLLTGSSHVTVIQLANAACQQSTCICIQWKNHAVRHCMEAHGMPCCVPLQLALNMPCILALSKHGLLRWSCCVFARGAES